MTSYLQQKNIKETEQGKSLLFAFFIAQNYFNKKKMHTATKFYEFVMALF